MTTIARLLLLAAAPAFVLPAAVSAQAADPAVGPVQALNAGLLDIMRAGRAAGVDGRATRIGPVVDRSFDIPLMTRLAVGPAWAQVAAEDRTALTAAFRRLTIRQFAKNFDGFAGERFQVAPQVESRGSDRLVRTTLAAPGGSPTAISYRLRQSGGQWRIVDVFYRNSISQLATRRADFAGVLRSGGAKALIAHLDRLAAQPAA